MLTLDLSQYESRVFGPRRLAPKREKLAPPSPGSVAEAAALAIATTTVANVAAAWVYDRFIVSRRKKAAKKSQLRNGVIIEIETIQRRIEIRTTKRVRLTRFDK